MIKIKKTVTTLFCIYSLCLFANNRELPPEKMFYPKKDSFPAEFIFLIESIQSYKLSAKERSLLKKSIYTLNYLSTFVSQKDLSFILRLSIYKHFLEMPGQNQSVTEDSNYISSNIDNYLKTHGEDLHSFAKWFLSSLQKDFDNLVSSSPFKRTKGSKTPTNSDKPKKIDKKIRILLRIFNNMTSMQPEEVHLHLKDHMLSLLKILSHKSWLLGQLSQFKEISKTEIKMNAKDLTSFSFVSPLSKLPTQSNLKSFLQSIPKLGAEKTYKEALKWVPKEHGFNKLDFLFPKKDPNYVRPSTLPKPVDDWDNEYAKAKEQ